MRDGEHANLVRELPEDDGEGKPSQHPTSDVECQGDTRDAGKAFGRSCDSHEQLIDDGHLVVAEAGHLCLGGARACPPEDCGGPGGYEHLLEVLQDEKSEEHDELLAWVGGHFDPEGFDVNRTNAALRVAAHR